MSNQISNFYSALLAAEPSTPYPSKWTYSYLQQIRARAEKIAARNEGRIDSIAQARVMPEIGNISIGSGKYFSSLAVLFLDICGFSNWDNWEQVEQANVLRVMNIFMASMLGVIRDFGGTCEKNTGDGLMAYFNEGDEAEQARTATEAASVMRYTNDNIVSPILARDGFPQINFRIGIDTGPVTIARVGLHSAADQFVAIGTTANVACKLMRLVGDGGICIGHHTYTRLPLTWQNACAPAGQTQFVYRINHCPYIAWRVEQALREPRFHLTPLGSLV